MIDARVAVGDVRAPTRAPGLRAGSPWDVGIDPRGLARAARLAEGLVDRGTVPAAGFAVARRGHLVYAGTWGTARGDPPTPTAPTTHFAVASVTKPLTATAVMVLVDEGRLHLDAPVATYVREFAARENGAITLRHLLTHTSGLDDAAMPREPARTPEEHMARIFALAPRFAPGVHYAYCNAGYRVLGEVVGRVTGAPHERFFAERVLMPLGMRDSYLRPDPSLLARVASVEREPGGLLRGMCASGSTAGGLFSTVTDIVRLGQLFLDGGAAMGGRILTRATVEAMTRDQAYGATDALGKPVAQGLGWMLRPRLRFSALASPGAFAHPGATGCWLVVEPERDLVFGFVANRWGWSGYGRRQVLDAVLEALVD